MDNLEKIKRHLAKPIPLTFKNVNGEEDTFDFKPLNIEQQAIFMELSRKVQSRPKITIEGVEVPETTKEDMNDMFNLMVDIVISSLNVENEIGKAFVNNNFNELFEKVLDLLPKNPNQSALDKIKKKQEELKLAR